MSFPRYPAYKDSGVEWLGSVPLNWRRARFKEVFQEREERSIAGEETLLSVSAYTGVTPRSEIMEDGDHLSRAESLEGYKVCYPNDLVMNIMLAWNRGLGMSPIHGICSPAYSVFQIVDESSPRYLHYLLRSDEYIRYFKAFSAGVIDSRLRLYPDAFGALSTYLPSTEEQAQIACFLDRETAKIDALVAEQEQLITLLKEKRQAVISHAVTKGLDPSVPMKDSGVEWLGEVPAHWQVNRLQRVVQPGTSVTYGIVQAGPDIEGGIPYIRTSDMAGDELPLDGYPKTSPEIDASYARSKVSTGDLVIAIRATVGKCLPVPQELDGANLTQGTARIAPGPDTDPGYLLSFINGNGAQTYFDRMAKGATFREITLEALRKTPVLVPPLDEQCLIASWVKQQSEQFLALIREAEQTQVLLKERRSALISAAVTGQIDVRGLATA